MEQLPGFRWCDGRLPNAHVRQQALNDQRDAVPQNASTAERSTAPAHPMEVPARPPCAPLPAEFGELEVGACATVPRSIDSMADQILTTVKGKNSGKHKLEKGKGKGKRKSGKATASKAKSKAKAKAKAKAEAPANNKCKNLAFPGKPKKPCAPIAFKDFKIYTSFSSNAWRVLKKGERVDKAVKWSDAKEAWAEVCSLVGAKPVF